jgi:hypothetical protein
MTVRLKSSGAKGRVLTNQDICHIKSCLFVYKNIIECEICLTLNWRKPRRRHQTSVLFPLKRCIRNASLPENLSYRYTVVSLLEHKRDLRLRELRLLHEIFSSPTES